LVLKLVVCGVDGGPRVLRVEDPAGLFGVEEIGPFTAAEGLRLRSAESPFFLASYCGTEGMAIRGGSRSNR